MLSFVQNWKFENIDKLNYLYEIQTFKIDKNV